MKHLILMRGIPGSGKSTEALRLSDYGMFSAIISADDEMFADGQSFDPTRLAECHQKCLRSCEENLAQGQTLVIVANTNIHVSDMSPYYKLAQTYGYQFTIYQIHCDPYVAHSRCQHGNSLDSVIGYAKRLYRERIPAYWDIWTKGTPWVPPEDKKSSPEDDSERARR